MTGPVFRAARLDDAQDLADLAAQPRVVWGTLQLPAQTPEQWRKRLDANSPDTSYVLVAEADNRAVGMLGLYWSSRPRTRHVAHLGMFVHDDYQGMGIGTGLMQTALEAADRWLNLVRLELEVYPDNERAIALYRRFGFVEEGRKRLNAWRDGQYVDSLIMGRIRADMGG